MKSNKANYINSITHCTFRELNMVWRSLEIKEIIFDRKGKDKESVLAYVKNLFGNKVEVVVDDEKIRVKGDMHNYKKRKTLIKYLMEG